MKQSLVARVFCSVFVFWKANATATKNDPLVKFLDSFVSGCVYCWLVRALLLGLGVGLLVGGHWVLGPGLIVLPWLFAWGERRWMCEEAEVEKE
jgi:Na+-transporting NADH:ubiquinone oxidoreductase subunit NqrD